MQTDSTGCVKEGAQIKVSRASRWHETRAFPAAWGSVIKMSNRKLFCNHVRGVGNGSLNNVNT